MENAFTLRDVSVHYGAKMALKEASLDIAVRKTTALIGPSGCGKSTLLRSLNRMNDTVEGCRVEGQVLLRDLDIYHPNTDVVDLRKRVGMVFQEPNPFPKSIAENVSYGPRIAGVRSPRELERRVEEALRRAALWDEVKDRLDASAMALSGGQQQRLCIARALAVEPEVLLMDEPTSALDPIATQAVEHLIDELSERYTIVIVTHNMQQAQRIADYTAFFYLGELVEVGPTESLFESPTQDRTRGYVRGVFG